jgi:uncharacterized protein YndB with AHSA1/START domain
MHTKLFGRAETRSVTITAPPTMVIDLLSDARRLPDWAPGFASRVEPAGEDWVIESGESRFRIRLQVSRDAATVDLVRPRDPNRGAYMRVVPNGAASELLFALLFPAGTADELIAAQMTNVETELRTVRDLCEAQAGMT